MFPSERKALIVALVWLLLASPAGGQAILKRAKHYTFTADEAALYNTMVLSEAAELSASGGREHALARLERLAHDYAYGAGVNKGWKDVRLLARLKADGYHLVETLINPEDGMAAIVVQDVRTGGHVIAFRGTDTVLAGWNRHGCCPKLDPDAYTDLVEADYAEVGASQFHAHRKIMDRWAQQYGKDGKLQVTGHSLGGGLAGLFTASHPTTVKKLVTFQAPAQLPASARRYEQAMAKLPADQRPENVAVIAIDDAVSCAGEVHVGSPKIILTMANDHGATKAFGHLSFLLQPDNCVGTALGKGKYRDAGDGLFRLEMDYTEFRAFRAVSQLKGSDSLLEKKRKWRKLSDVLRVCMRDGQMLALAAGRPLDPQGKTPPPVDVQERIATLAKELYDFAPHSLHAATVDNVGEKYVLALTALRDGATSDELRKNYEAEIELWGKINGNIGKLRTDPRHIAMVHAINIDLLTKRYRLLRQREKIKAPDLPVGELMLYVAVSGAGANVKNVGASVRISGPSGVFTRDKTGCLFRNLAPGTYRILVTADGFEPARDTVQMAESLPKKRLYRRVVLKAIPNWRPYLGLPAPPGTVQLIARNPTGKKAPPAIYLRISQPEKRYMEGYGWIMRFWKVEPGRYDLALLAPGFQSDVKRIDLTARQIANGYSRVLTLYDIPRGHQPYSASAYLTAVKAYFDAYQQTLTKAKGYDEKKRDKLEQLQLAALRHVASFPHNETAQLWKALHEEKKAREKQWQQETRNTPRDTKSHLLQVCEKDRPRLKEIVKEAKALDALARRLLNDIVIPKDDWHSSPGRLFSELVRGKNRNIGYAFLPSPPHPARWGKPSKYPFARVPAGLQAVQQNLQLHDKRRVEISQMLSKARALKDDWMPQIRKMKDLADEVAEMVRRKKQGQ